MLPHKMRPRSWSTSINIPKKLSSQMLHTVTRTTLGRTVTNTPELRVLAATEVLEWSQALHGILLHDLFPVAQAAVQGCIHSAVESQVVLLNTLSPIAMPVRKQWHESHSSIRKRYLLSQQPTNPTVAFRVVSDLRAARVEEAVLRETSVERLPEPSRESRFGRSPNRRAQTVDDQRKHEIFLLPYASSREIP